MAAMEVSESGFPFEDGETVCLCSYTDKPNVRKDDTGWNLGIGPNGQLIFNCGRGKRAQWQVVRHEDGKISLRTKIGDGKKNVAGNDLGWHLGITNDGTVIPNAGQGPFGRFTPVAITEPAANPVEGGESTKPKVKYCFLCAAHEDKKNRAGGNGWHLGVLPKGEVIGNAGRGEAGQFIVVGVTEKEALKTAQVPKLKGLGKNLALRLDKPFTTFDPTKVYYMARIPGRHVKAVLTVKKQLTRPARHWVAYSPLPPASIACQDTKIAGLKLSPSIGSSEAVAAQPTQLTHPMLFLHLKGDQWPAVRKGACFEYTIDAQLYITRLKEKDPATKAEAIPVAQDITPEEAQVYLRQTSHIDYNNPRFQQWLDTNKLRPNNEHALAFALRVFQFVRSTFKYEFVNDMDRRASGICKAGKTDCGGFGILFSAIMRPNGIPTRLLFGRWAASQKSRTSYNQVHVKAEFFVKGIGWIPVDLASSILHDKTPPYMKHFGKDNGDLVVMHIEHDICVDTLYYGRSVELCCQGVLFWTGPEGRGDGATESHWEVTKVE